MYDCLLGMTARTVPDGTWRTEVVDVARHSSSRDGRVGRLRELAGVVAFGLRALVALAGVIRRKAWAPALAAVTGVATIAGFALFHALPLRSEVTEPYFGHHGTTNGAQVASLALIAVAAVWVTVEAVQALRSPEAA